mmetsp:Transcript_23798/g.56195  ORF Transcript_23798/g.56195 Transcript_23798/m.56195 type:complete len:703 (+) Transcript_23798:145-2253(+)
MTEEKQDTSQAGGVENKKINDGDDDDSTMKMTMLSGPIKCLPYWKYQAPRPDEKPMFDPLARPEIDSIDLGNYVRTNVTNLQPSGKSKDYFVVGLRLMLSYQHELASRCFLACLEESPYCALAHGLISLCHSPNYNFKGEAYYESAHHPDDAVMNDLLCIFPSQQVADRHSKIGVDLIEKIRKMHPGSGKGGKKGKSKGGKKSKGKMKRLGSGSSHASSSQHYNDDNNSNNPEKNGRGIHNESLPAIISDVETQLLLAVRVLTRHPGLEHTLSDDIVGRPYADAMRKVHNKYPDDPEVAYFFAESLMVLNAWKLYEYPTGKPTSPDVDEVQGVLEKSLNSHKEHAGLCHMYVHLSEMSSHPEAALEACEPLRNKFPQAGHLRHMSTHLDVLLGAYDNCVYYNLKAIEADEKSMRISPGTAGRESFYYGYIVHNFHMGVYGAILGGYEKVAMELSEKLNQALSEQMFEEHPDLSAYLEAYSALDVHVLIRFGRWEQILELQSPNNKQLMLFRAASIKYGKALAHANLGNVKEAKKELNNLDSLRGDPDAPYRILHNNSVENLLAVDSVMAHGEIAYRSGEYEKAFKLLRLAVQMQDNLNYDEPWGKMQPIRHALGGLLNEQGHIVEAEAVFRRDLELHPRNPWALVGLISVLKNKAGGCCQDTSDDISREIEVLETLLNEERNSEWAVGTEITVPCACCGIED